jgi:preprotein translocase subunit SecD
VDKSTVDSGATPSRSANPPQLSFRKVLTALPCTGAPTSEPVPPTQAPGGPAPLLAPTSAATPPGFFQSADPAQQQAALAALVASGCDPVTSGTTAAAENPDLPLVTTDRKRTEAYLLDSAVLTGADVQDATASPDPNSPGQVINLQFRAQGARTWATFTSDNVNNRVAITLDGGVISAPSINSPITGGQTQISGDFTRAEAAQLARDLSGR